MKNNTFSFINKCIILSLTFIFISCSNNQNKYWKNINSKKITLNLEIGDIIIKEKQFSLLGIFGHSAIMKTEHIILDYPKLGETSYEIDINYWLEKNRKILILRYIDMNENFKKKLIENLEYYKTKYYRLSFNKKNTNGFYCSQFIWFIYFKTAKDLGLELDLDSNNGFFVLPYDFINSKKLYIVD